MFEGKAERDAMEVRRFLSEVERSYGSLVRAELTRFEFSSIQGARRALTHVLDRQAIQFEANDEDCSLRISAEDTKRDSAS